MKPVSFLSGSGRGWLILLSFLSMLVRPAMAHPILQNPIWIELAPDRMKVKLYVSIRELNVVQGLPIAPEGTLEMGLAEESAPRHSPYVLDHLHFRGDGAPLTGRVLNIEPPKHVGKGSEAPDRAHFIYYLEYQLTTPPARVTFSHTMVKEFPSAPGVPWDLSYAYRFGPVDAVPTQFGAIPRDTEVFYDTGFAAASGQMAVALPPQPHQGFLIRLALLGAALGLGIQHLTQLGRVALASGLAGLAGWAIAVGTGWTMPPFLAAALGGIGILLASVDNIHRSAKPPTLRRWWLITLFPLVSGWAAWGVTKGSALTPAVLGGFCLLAFLGALVAGAALVSLGAKPASSNAAPARRPLLQLASLLVCLGGLVILFDGLGLRPWAYWLDRLKG